MILNAHPLLFGLSCLVLTCLPLGVMPPTLSAADASPAPRLQFNRDIRPILADACFVCHGPDKNKRPSALRLDVEESAKADIDGMRAIVPGKLADSELWLRIISTDESERMPPSKATRKLSTKEIETLKTWIEQGAPYEKHWSFLPPQRPPLPAVKLQGWVRNPIDAFVLSRLEQAGLSPSPEAPKETLLRRVTFDLTGLPPTLDEIDAFLKDTSPQAYEKVVDRLLFSPRYGERMIVEWLDAARYSDTNGYQTDGTRPMWPWRDWVLDAFNQNMPFDQFTIEQLAGDLLPAPAEATPSADPRTASIITTRRKIATGFHRNHMLNGEGGRIAEESRVDYVVDRVETTSAVWLGLTLGCCRCHDHKYDPFTQKDFYQLAAYFNSINETGGVDRRSSTAAPLLELPTIEQRQLLAELPPLVAQHEKSLKDFDAETKSLQDKWAQETDREKLAENVRQALAVEVSKRTDEHHKLIAEAFAAAHPDRAKSRQPLQKELDDTRKKLADAQGGRLPLMVMEDRPQPRDTFILIRGAYDKYGEKVTHGVPSLLSNLPADAPKNRLGLAQWLVDPAHPLTPRVTVNRFWQMVWGTGLVKTAEDFGVQGELPSHPELLDWLASEFVRPQEPLPSIGPSLGQPSVATTQFGLTTDGTSLLTNPQATPGTTSTSIPARPWDMKRLMKLIVTSAAYRQSSRVTPALLERDPENQLLSRGPRYRLNSHFIRDQALAVSGLLVEKQGGPPVKPYQPPGIWEEFSFNKFGYTQDKGENLYRRSIYTFWRRSVGPTTMFDTPTRQVCTVKQTRTNTPLQSLILLNDVTYAEASRMFAERLLKMTTLTHEQRLVTAFRLVTSRPPKPQELSILNQAWQRAHTLYQSDTAAATRLITRGEAPRDATLDVAQHAAWTTLASLLLNLDEALTRE